MLIETPAPKSQPLYVKIPNVTGLYRHAVSGRYYGAKKVGGKRREVSLKTTDRKIAERRMKDWVASLAFVDREVERTTLRELLRKSVQVNQGRATSTQTTNRAITRHLEKTWPGGRDIEVFSSLLGCHPKVDARLYLHRGLPRTRGGKDGGF